MIPTKDNDENSLIKGGFPMIFTVSLMIIYQLHASQDLIEEKCNQMIHGKVVT